MFSHIYGYIEIPDKFCEIRLGTIEKVKWNFYFNSDEHPRNSYRFLFGFHNKIFMFYEIYIPFGKKKKKPTISFTVVVISLLIGYSLIFICRNTNAQRGATMVTMVWWPLVSTGCQLFAYLLHFLFETHFFGRLEKSQGRDFVKFRNRQMFTLTDVRLKFTVKRWVLWVWRGTNCDQGVWVSVSFCFVLSLNNLCHRDFGAGL